MLYPNPATDQVVLQLGGNPLGGTPLGGTPLGGTPLGGTPLGGTPLPAGMGAQKPDFWTQTANQSPGSRLSKKINSFFLPVG